MTMSSLKQTNIPACPMLEAYRRPYHEPVNARMLLLALERLALVNVWPFRDSSNTTEPLTRFPSQMVKRDGSGLAEAR